MALSKLESLYKTVVSEHSRHPHHHGKIPGVEVLEMYNPTCGDIIELSVKIDDMGKIQDIAFDGSGCSISTASASMMTDIVVGKQIDQAKELAETFSRMVQGQSEKEQEKLGEASLLAGVAKYPQRIKCATLSWNALKKAIRRYEEGE